MIDYSIGKRARIAERIGGVINARTEAGRKLRIKTEEAVVTVTPTWETENIQGGTLLGAIIAAASTVADDSIIPLGSETEITDAQVVDNGVMYTVNVDAAFQNQARFKAMIESGTGFTSLITDKFDMEQEAVLKERPARDTWQFKVLVDDEGMGEDLGLL